jgi:hypothetical protein
MYISCVCDPFFVERKAPVLLMERVGIYTPLCFMTEINEG